MPDMMGSICDVSNSKVFHNACGGRKKMAHLIVLVVSLVFWYLVGFAGSGENGVVVVVLGCIVSYFIFLSLPLAIMRGSCLACCVKTELQEDGDSIYDSMAAGSSLSKVTANSPPTAHDLFISYKSEDSEQVYNSLLTRLSEKGLNVFNSARDFAGATPSKDLMGQHAAGSVVLLALVSPNYFDSPWCRHEAVSAKQAGVPIIPVYSGDVRAAPSISQTVCTFVSETAVCAAQPCRTTPSRQSKR
jgi:hypothetical protein